MNNAQLRHIAAGLYRNMQKPLQETGGRNGKEAIHDFRVAYKKLRAFLRMLTGAPPGLMPRGMKLLYGMAGQLRDQQLLLAKLIPEERAGNCPAELVQRLRMAIRKDGKALATLVSAGHTRSDRAGIEQLLPARFSLNAFGSYATAKRQEVQETILRKMYRDAQLHQIRKCLKDLYYTTSLYTGVVQRSVFTKAWKGASAAMVRTILDELGFFQDSCTAIALLSGAIRNQWAAAEKEQLLALRKKWIREKLRQKKVLIRELPLLLHQ